MAVPQRQGTQGRPVDAGLIARAAAAVGAFVGGGIYGAMQGAIRGASEAWFGPQQPITPQAPEQVRGRSWDYPVAANITYRPRGEPGETGIDFATLRQLADTPQGGLDLLRLAIETRKDQMATQRWAIKNRDGSDGGERARALEKKLRMPDGEHTWLQWQRLLLDDLFVIDAPCVYFAPDPEGGPDRIPQIMDGALLKRLIRPDGRTPLPPEPAFQQALKGMPAVDYSLAELVYLPRNLRSNRLYGMSPVEQVVMTVQIALRRQLSQLEHYTAGSVPDMVFGVPESWTATQIEEFQAWWDSLLSGNTEELRRARFIPGGIKPFPLKEGALKDEYDEWLARIICYAFSLSPQALIKQMNRATADTAKESAQEEGLEPVKLHWKDFVDAVILKGFNEPDLELAYEDEEIVDPVDKANVMSIALGKKPWLTVDEVREDYGRNKLTPDQKDELMPPPPPQLQLGDGEDGAPPPKDGEAAAAPPPSGGKSVKALLAAQREATTALVEAARGLQKAVVVLRGSGGRSGSRAAGRRSVTLKRDPKTGVIDGFVVDGELHSGSERE